MGAPPPRWGWHRLEPHWAERLVAASPVGRGDVVLDVGAGLGALTAPLLAGPFVAVGLEPKGFTVGVSWWAIGVSVLVGLVVGAAGVWLSARRAGRVPPLDALRDAAVEKRPMTRTRWATGVLCVLAGGGLALLLPGATAQDKPTIVLLSAMTLLVAAALLAVLSEILVGSIEPFIEQFGLSEFFVGVVLIPTIGNLAEHLVAVQLAYKNKMEFAMAVAYGSSLQVALFVAPVLVLIGVLIGQPMDLVFTPLEVAAVAAAVGISALIALDGESNWLEGALLMIVYAILAISFFEFQQPI